MAQVAPDMADPPPGGSRKGHKPPHMGREEREAVADALLAMGGGEEESRTFFAQLARACAAPGRKAFTAEYGLPYPDPKRRVSARR